jgi:hypothetical protein
MAGYATAQMVRKRAPRDAWSDLQSAMEAAVLDCALVAGERLWTIAGPLGTGAHFRICAEWDTRNYVLVELDQDRNRIVCRFGPAVSRLELSFDIAGQGLRCDGTELPVASAAAMVLDQLIFPEE